MHRVLLSLLWLVFHLTNLGTSIHTSESDLTPKRGRIRAEITRVPSDVEPSLDKESSGKSSSLIPEWQVPDYKPQTSHQNQHLGHLIKQLSPHAFAEKSFADAEQSERTAEGIPEFTLRCEIPAQSRDLNTHQCRGAFGESLVRMDLSMDHNLNSLPSARNLIFRTRMRITRTNDSSKLSFSMDEYYTRNVILKMRRSTEISVDETMLLVEPEAEEMKVVRTEAHLLNNVDQISHGPLAFAVGNVLHRPLHEHEIAQGRFTEQSAYIIMDDVQASDLFRFAHERNKDESSNSLSNTKLTFNLVSQIGKQLKHLHSDGWVHRDVKLENILIMPDEIMALIDYDLARPGDYATDSCSGSMPYASPFLLCQCGETARNDVNDALTADWRLRDFSCDALSLEDSPHSSTNSDSRLIDVFALGVSALNFALTVDTGLSNVIDDWMTNRKEMSQNSPSDQVWFDDCESCSLPTFKYPDQKMVGYYTLSKCLACGMLDEQVEHSLVPLLRSLVDPRMTSEGMLALFQPHPKMNG